MVLMTSLYLIVIYIMLNNGRDNLGVTAQTSLVAAIWIRWLNTIPRGAQPDKMTLEEAACFRNRAMGRFDDTL